ncbi:MULTISPECIES: c-type cytochrome [Halomonadaceae]|jgi:cytochrome c5|uniref:Cytochrome c5 family protein n=1 Tax=Vreelandella halophila TaxID=86177 RepID=A0A9X4YA33_9GAMM|nr:MULTISPECIES: cytochrome c5 family protein [Halomonas]MYL26122.1 cytochrome c5 family protein [Halomonas utahensis]MYL73316.1 cytochrome c5 family protein [Halomonas sp. 22501_18_FS]
MNKLTRIFASLGLIVALGGSALTLAAVEDQIRERIEPTGNVNIAGEEGQQRQQQSTGPRGGEEVYADACSACHDSGAAGAPKLGDSGAWADRISKGDETLYDHAINGFNAMPAKGGCSGCSDEEVQNAVDYMTAQSE